MSTAPITLPVVLPSARSSSPGMHPGDALTRSQRLTYVIVLGALTALGPFTIDLYLPAMPSLARDFAAPTALVQLTLTATTVGFGLGQLIVGPWSDRVGRRLPLLLATSVHVLSCIAAAAAPSVEVLAVVRVAQGVGAAAGGVVAMATVRDLFGGRPLVRMLSRLALVSGMAPVLAPVIGSQLLLVMPWRGVFLALAGYGLAVLVVAALLIVETLPPHARRHAGHSTARDRYRAIFTDRVFVGTLIVGAMNFTGLFAYLSSSSFLFQGVYGFTAQQYGLLFAVNSIGVVAGVQTSSRLAHRFGPQWVLAGSTAVGLISSLTIVGLSLAGAGLVGVLVPLWFFIASCGFAFPCVQVLALAGHGAEAGTAASVLGACNFGVAGILSPLVGLLGVTSAVPMGAVMAGAVAIGMLGLWLVVRPRTVPPLAP